MMPCFVKSKHVAAISICNNKRCVPTDVIIACSTITTRTSHSKVRLLVNVKELGRGLVYREL